MVFFSGNIKLLFKINLSQNQEQQNFSVPHWIILEQGNYQEMITFLQSIIICHSILIFFQMFPHITFNNILNRKI